MLFDLLDLLVGYKMFSDATRMNKNDDIHKSPKGLFDDEIKDGYDYYLDTFLDDCDFDEEDDY